MVRFIGITLGILGALVLLAFASVLVFCVCRTSRAQSVVDKVTDHIAGIGS